MSVPSRSALNDLDRYEPGRPATALRRELGIDHVVKLASNEGQFGPLPAALEAIAAYLPQLNRYPELAADAIDRIASRHDIEPDRIALGNGADAIIGYLASAYLNPGDQVAMCWPSFPTYRLDVLKMGARPVMAPLAAGSYDLAALLEIIDPQTRMVFVCNPNNPTGGIVTATQLRSFLDQVPESVLVVIDEAYHEYVRDPDYPDAIAEHARHRPNVVVLRTLSKAFGLAGLRFGYLVGPPDVADAVGRVRHYYDVSELAHIAAIASLDNEAEITERAQTNQQARERLIDELRRLGFEPLPAHGNFVCFPCADPARLADDLLGEGVIVRELAGFGAPEMLRISVGTDTDHAALLAALARRNAG